jgi:hypothetical protein
MTEIANWLCSFPSLLGVVSLLDSSPAVIDISSDCRLKDHGLCDDLTYLTEPGTRWRAEGIAIAL